MPSGEDPIGRSPTAADAAHVMEMVTRYEQQDELSETVREGRFGRDARQGDHVDEARTDKQSDDDRWEPLVDYVVNPLSVHRNGNRAHVDITAEGYGAPDLKYTLYLVHEDGDWRVCDVRYRDRVFN